MGIQHFGNNTGKSMSRRITPNSTPQYRSFQKCSHIIIMIREERVTRARHTLHVEATKESMPEGKLGGVELKRHGGGPRQWAWGQGRIQCTNNKSQ